VSDLTFAMEILDTRKRCENCYHYRHNYCALNSCNCANDVAHHASDPSRWMSYEEGEESEERLQGKKTLYYDTGGA
jgi:hypothetical protein